ncbi:MAG: hypothetical protein K0S12_1752 [Bacteroidetes bacterium]|jgi:hypothetical protein|nr:hypothetical protein [Bacteroidota bacterium]
MKITPALIPHSEFHTGSWLQNSENPGWYYFSKRKNKNIILNDGFIESVDEPLRDLVTFLHSRNIKTTPSCAGHYISDRDLSKIYDTLEEDQEHICGKGLHFKDVESNRLYFYKDQDYTLPWTRDKFLDEISIYQHRGVLGMRLGNRKKIKDNLLKLQMDGVITDVRDSILFIFTDQPGENNWKWREITKEVKKILG